MSFFQEEPAGHVWLKFRANPYEKLSCLMWEFDEFCDHARVLYGPTASEDHVSPIILYHQPPSWIVPEKMFWEDCGPDGTRTRVASVQVNFTSRAVTGVTFTYAAGNTHTLGSQGGESTTMFVDSREKLTRMDVGAFHDGRLQFISFYTNNNRQMIHEPQKPPEQAEQYAPNESFYHVFELAPSLEIGRAPVRAETYRFPPGGGSFVGFWGKTSRRERRLISLKPIFTKCT
ncbi:MAG: hypothetical protein M1837_004130 [Sclerophora amabilis]|nr:MAG: hypothetical protein M1837_004130 [Sclerophora amabilis]